MISPIDGVREHVRNVVMVLLCAIQGYDRFVKRRINTIRPIDGAREHARKVVIVLLYAMIAL